MASLLDPNPDDLAQLQGLLTQFEPSQAVKNAARQQAQMQFFLGLLGAPKGGEFQRIGQSGIGAMQTYQDRIKQEQALRQQNVQAAAQVSNILRQQRLLKTAQDIFTGASDQPPAPGGAPAPAGGAPAMGGMPPTMPSGVTTAPAPAPQAPQAAPMSVPTWRQLMPRAEQAMALASGDPKTIVESIRHYTDTKLGPNGLVTTVTGIPLYQSTDAGIQMFSPDGRPAEFMPYGQGATDAAASRNAAIEGAKTKATEGAKAQFDLITVPSVTDNGLPGPSRLMTRAQYLASQNQPPQTPPYTPNGRVELNLTPDAMTPTNIAGIRRDIQSSGYGLPSQISPPQMGVTASPLTTKSAEADIATNQSLNTKLGESVIGQIDKQYDPARDAAIKTIPSIHEARAILDSGKVITGAGANIQVEFGRWLSKMGMGGNDYVANTQAFIANQAKQVMGVVKQLGSGSGISNSDREYAAKAQGGQIEANEESLRRILDISERASRELISKFNSSVERAGRSFQRPDLVDFYRVEMPDLYSSPQNNARAQMTGPGGQTQPLPNYGKGLMPPPATEVESVRRAIANGADPAAVKKRMMERGFDPSGL